MLIDTATACTEHVGPLTFVIHMIHYLASDSLLHAYLHGNYMHLHPAKAHISQHSHKDSYFKQVARSHREWDVLGGLLFLCFNCPGS